MQNQITITLILTSNKNQTKKSNKSIRPHGIFKILKLVLVSKSRNRGVACGNSKSV